MQDNEEIIATEPAEEFEKKVQTLRAKKTKKKGGGRKPMFVEIDGYKVRPSGNGPKILIDGLNEKRQKEILEGIKQWISKGKE